MTPGRTAALLATATVALLGAMIPFRTSPATLWGDEGTFVAMSESLVADGDLRFDARDRARLLALDATDEGGGTVILQRGPAGSVSYSKPVLYPLLAAPFVALLGRSGPIALNILALAFAAALAFHDLRQRSDRGMAALVLVTFLGAGTVLPYVLWRMSDSLQLSVVLAGLVLSLRPPSRAEPGPERGWIARLRAWPGAPYLGAVLLGAAVMLRVSNVALAAMPALAALFERRLRRAVALALVAGLAAAAFLTLGAVLTGSLLPYRAERSSFNRTSGYPSADDQVAQEAFADRPATHHTSTVPTAGLDRSIYAAFYFLFGRHSGLLIYFPAALALIVAALRRRDAAGMAALLGFAGAVSVFLLWMPWNYFGGNTFLGNRYLLSAYPALLVAPRFLPSRRMLGAAWLLALLATGSALVSVVRFHEFDRSSQSHTRAGIFRLLPYESTARDLCALDRYWGDLFVRFVDPFAEVEPWDFVLERGRPPAELMIAEWQQQGTLRLLVATEAPGATLTFRDWRQRTSFELDAMPHQDGRAIVDLSPSWPWRWHRFWWHPTQRYGARVLRLGLEAPDGAPARAQIRLLGDPALFEAAFAYTRERLELPAEVIAGSTTTVRIAVRNTSRRIWRREGVTPIFARFHLAPLGPGLAEDGDAEDGDAEDGAAEDESAVRLPESVDLRATTTLAIPLTWPTTTGTWRLEIDLVQSHVGTFASRLGRPLVRETIRVLPATPTP